MARFSATSGVERRMNLDYPALIDLVSDRITLIDDFSTEAPNRDVLSYTVGMMTLLDGFSASLQRWLLDHGVERLPEEG